MRVDVGDADEATLAWLHQRLPGAEFATQFALGDGDAHAVRAVADGPPAAVGVALSTTESLSGAPVLVGVAADDRLPDGAGGELGDHGLPPAVDRLVDELAALARRGGSVELLGPGGLATRLAAATAARVGGTPRRVMAQQLLGAVAVRRPPDPGGRARPAVDDDVELVARWYDAFAVEALGADARGADRWTAQVAGAVDHLWIWEDADGQPASFVHCRPTTRVSSRVGPVWTPPGRRGRGHAAALTAHATRAALVGGDQRVVLLTDATNPTSNRLYRRIGYRLVCDHVSWVVTAG